MAHKKLYRCLSCGATNGFFFFENSIGNLFIAYDSNGVYKENNSFIYDSLSSVPLKNFVCCSCGGFLGKYSDVELFENLFYSYSDSDSILFFSLGLLIIYYRLNHLFGWFFLF